MRLRVLLVSVVLTASAWAGIVDDVRAALAQNSFSAAEAALNSYRGQQGENAEYAEAYSWLGRAALEQHEYDRAAAYGKQTKTLVLEQLKKGPLDAEQHLPIALGAAYEVESQAMAAKGQRTQAVALVTGCAGEICEYFDSGAAAEESEFTFSAGQGGARLESGAVAGCGVAGGGFAER